MIFKCRDKNIEYGNEPLIMGIINVTPDSFSDGGDYAESDNAINHAKELIADGADILDFGAQSTRPGHTPVSAEEEIKRLSAVIPAVRSFTDKPISVDTYYPEVAKKVIEWGADIINDVSGVINPDMASLIKKSGAGWIIMHSTDGSITEVSEFFASSIYECEAYGIDKEQICLDMGIGFGKTRQQDLELIAGIKQYKVCGYPLLLGTSRKRVIGEYSGQSEPKERIYGNIAADTAAIFGGVDIIRLHDVKHEKQGIKMAYALKKALSE